MALDRKRVETLRDGIASHVQSQSRAGNYRPNEIAAALDDLRSNFDEHVLGIPKRPADAPDDEQPQQPQQPQVVTRPAGADDLSPEETAAVQSIRARRRGNQQ